MVASQSAILLQYWPRAAQLQLFLSYYSGFMLLLQPAMIDWGPCFSFVSLVEQLAAEDSGLRPRVVEIASAVTICRQQLWPRWGKLACHSQRMS